MKSVDMIGSRTPLVLIVDDLADNIKVSGNILAGQGIDIAAATSGEQALRVVASDRPDLILLDLQMPEMNGMEVCRRIKDDDATSHIPVIFLTAHGEAAEIVSGFAAGAVDYIVKPFNAQELVARVMTHLNLVAARSEAAAKNAELDVRNRELREAVASKDNFFSIISHDLKNIVGSMNVYTDLLKKNLGRMSMEELERSVDIVNQSSMQIYGLLDNLVKWAASQTGRIDYNPEPIDLAGAVNECLTALESAARIKRISVTHNVEAGLRAFSDRNMLLSVLRNFVSNAIKFSHAGSEVRINAVRATDGILVSVVDSGVGIPPEEAAKLFRVDVRHKTSGTAGEQGSGIGLILCKEFVEMNGGKISIESVPGNGSTFAFTVPEYLEYYMAPRGK